jgi:adenylosuccinate lyase
LAVDAILNLYENIASGLVVYPQMIARHINEELPFMATENILMAAVKRGGDRQALHERIRKHSMAAAEQVKQFGQKNDLLERIAADPAFGLSIDELTEELSPEKFIGFAAEQTGDYLAEVRKKLESSGEKAVSTAAIEI